MHYYRQSTHVLLVFTCFLIGIILLWPIPSWGGTRTGPSGYTITEDLVSTGGTLLLQSGFSLNGATGQIVVGYSLDGSGNVVYHGVFGPLSGEGEGEGEGTTEGEGHVEGQVEGEGPLEGEIEGEGEPGEFSVTILGDTPVTVRKGAPHTFETAVSGQTGHVSYQWYIEASEKVFEPLPDSDGPSYAIESVQPEDGGLYVCEASDSLETVLSNTVELIVAAGAPAASGLGLVVLIAVTVLASVVVVHRKKPQGN